MCSVSRGSSLLAALLAALALAAPPSRAGPPMSALLDPPPPAHVTIPPGVFRVCADPNNLPFSDVRGEGFENAIAELIAQDLGRRVVYTWWPQRRGFVRKTLRAGNCDVIMGVPEHYGLTENTRAYYRSTYVFVSPAARHLRVSSLDDPKLRGLRIGVHVIGDDYQNPPPVQALAARHISLDLRGYSIYGDYSRPDPPHVLIDAVASGAVDVGIAWGPLAGYFAKRVSTRLVLTPVAPLAGVPDMPMTYAISVGVRHGDDAWRDAIDAVLARRAREIEQILRRYGVPLVTRAATRNAG